jgi:hypothetical protein
MKALLISLLVATLAMGGCWAQARDAKAILERARLASTLQTQDLKGHIRKSGVETPIQLFLRNEDIQLQYYDGKEWQKFHMRLKQGGGELFEFRENKNVKLNDEKLSKPIMNSDLTYEDLAMSFLYWDNVKILRQEKIGSFPCDLLQLVNPKGSGDYAIVYAWIHQEYGSLMKVMGADANNKPKKIFEVTDLMKVGEEYTLETMRVESYDQKSSKLTGTTYLEFEKPKANNKPL